MSFVHSNRLLFLFPHLFAFLISTHSVLSTLSPLFSSSTCPCIVHLSDPVTLAAGRLIGSTPTGLYITLLSASLDQIALTVNQQTHWDSMLHSHEGTRKQHTNAADNYISVTAISHYIQLPRAITLLTRWHICLSTVMSLSWINWWSFRSDGADGVCSFFLNLHTNAGRDCVV